jgi:hypothetical protein
LRYRSLLAPWVEFLRLSSFVSCLKPWCQESHAKFVIVRVWFCRFRSNSSLFFHSVQKNHTELLTIQNPENMKRKVNPEVSFGKSKLILFSTMHHFVWGIIPWISSFQFLSTELSSWKYDYDCLLEWLSIQKFHCL